MQGSQLLSVLAILVLAGGALFLFRGTVATPPVVNTVPTRPIVYRAARAPAPAAVAIPENAPGLTLWSAGNAATRDRRGFRHLGLVVPEGQAVSEFLPVGPFVAEYRGTLRIPTRDRFQFFAVGNGKLSLSVAGKQLLDGSSKESKPSRIKKGEHPFVLRYESPAQGPAVMRLEWQARDFAREPIPAGLLSHEALPFGDGYRRRGRQLVEQARCGRCHTELSVAGASAPILIGIGARVRHDWLAAWLEDPAAMRPQTGMPDLLHGAEGKQAAADLAAFLQHQNGKAHAARAGNPEQGAATFKSHGCIACHTLPDAEPDPARIRLDLLAAKWQPSALQGFLADPQLTHPDGGMPRYGFDEAQAADLSAYLLEASTGSLPKAAAGDVEAGRAWFASLGCAQCHGFPVPSQLPVDAPALGADGNPDCKLAAYPHDAEDRRAIRAYLEAPRPSERPDHAFARATLESARCFHCHAEGGRQSLLTRVRDEVGAQLGPLQAPPDLGPTGGKLRTDWLKLWLTGQVEERPRPWMHMPMPVFDLDSERLARGMAYAQGFVDSRMPELAGTERLAPVAEAPAAVGKTLLSEAQGFACVQCHAVGEQEAHAFEAPGPDLQRAPARLRPSFYRRWMLDPTRVDPGSKMTRFADNEGRTGLGDVLGGDARAQFEAIWRHLQALAGDSGGGKAPK